MKLISDGFIFYHNQDIIRRNTHTHSHTFTYIHAHSLTHTHTHSHTHTHTDEFFLLFLFYLTAFTDTLILVKCIDLKRYASFTKICT